MNNNNKNESSHNSSHFSSKDSGDLSDELPIDHSGYKTLVENFKKRDDQKIVLKTVHTYAKLKFLTFQGRYKKNRGISLLQILGY